MTKPYGRIYKNKTNISIDARDLYNVWPVGSIYMSLNNTNPANLFGGTWEAIEGRFLIGVGSSTDDNGETWEFAFGQAHGEYKHALVDSEIPNYTGFFPAVVPGGHANYCKGIFKASSTTDSGQTLSNEGIQQGGAYMWGYSIDIGGNGTHNNMPPYLAVYMWKRVA